MLTLVFGIYVSEAMVNRSLDLGLIAKETTRVYGHKFVFTHILYRVIRKTYFHTFEKLYAKISTSKYVHKNVFSV